MWVCRAGKESVYYERFIEESCIFLPWEGFRVDLSQYMDLAQLRKLVEEEKGSSSVTSVSNWASQLLLFISTIDIGDYVLIPSKHSKFYCLATITGEYTYSPTDKDGLCHSRSISIITNQIPKSAFSQSVIYSLGAYRTLFKVRDGEKVLSQIDYWREHL